jgi:hypothetical protein
MDQYRNKRNGPAFPAAISVGLYNRYKTPSGVSLERFETVTNDTPLRIDTGFTIIDRKSA